ncbi:hypothetical protein F4779DRAFT_639150 [Xylariaceae sp. FL0662B]|nr:hypothetical protein F4779DRAFT_639150 [Xylariaceae sp. FL0662B]
MPAPAEVQAATLERFIEGWSGWTPEGFLASWTSDCTTKTLPFSAGVETRTREESERIFPLMMSCLTNFQLRVHNVVHDPAQGKAAVYAVSKADTPFGPYNNEHAIFLWFDNSGEKVQKIEEMFDDVAMKDFLPKFEKYLAHQKDQAQA